MSVPPPTLLSTVAKARDLAQQGLTLRGYRELLDGLRRARSSPEWCVESKILWCAAVQVYEEQWFPADWQPLLNCEPDRPLAP